MEIPYKHRGRYFYHFTHISNIDSIIENGLLSTNEKYSKSIGHTDLANEDIQTRRSQMDVPCSPFGKIHDYVPFYFTTRNPMLLGVLHRKNIDQQLIVFIAISIDKLLEENVIFTDASANKAYPPNFYNAPESLEQLNWDLIDSSKWGRGIEQELNHRMAEVLVHKKVPVEWIDSFIVYNDICKKEIKRIFLKHGLKEPNIAYQPFKSKYFYFTKFFMENRTNETLITGPVMLKNKCINLINKVTNKISDEGNGFAVFRNITDALTKIDNDFCILSELKGIYELKTDNSVHSQNVSDHTIQVVNNLTKNEFYKSLSNEDREIVRLSAYLHDIGKGPKSKWKDGIQPSYPDHPADAIPMLQRILTEDFMSLSKYEIRKICLLVVYHDIIGDILGRGRSKKELLDLGIDENELKMLIAISVADIDAIDSRWALEVKLKLPNFIKEIVEEL